MLTIFARAVAPVLAICAALTALPDLPGHAARTDLPGGGLTPPGLWNVVAALDPLDLISPRRISLR